MQIVEGKQPQTEDFTRPEKVPQVGPGKSGDVRMGAFANRPRVLGVDQVLDVDRAVERHRHAVAGDAGGHHAVEHVHPAGDHFQNLRRRAETHRVARLVVGEKRHRVVDGAEHLVLRLAHRNAADGVAVEAEFHQLAGGLLAQVGVDRALDDAEMSLRSVARAGFVFRHPVLAALRPAGGQRERFRGVGLVARVGRAFVEEHRDVRAERALDFHAELGGEQHFRAVEVVLETHALFGDFAQFRQRPDLEAAGVGEHRLLPGGESMESAELADQLMAGPEPEVVGVSEDDLGAEFLDFRRMQGFDRALGADRHEDRRFDRAMGQNQACRGGRSWMDRWQEG